MGLFRLDSTLNPEPFCIMPSPTLFEPVALGTLRLANRTVRSATWEGLAAEDGSATPALVESMIRLARGGVGLIITGHAYVAPAGQAGRLQLGIDRDERLPGLRDLVRSVHAAGGKIAVQLAHSGGHASAKLTGCEPAGPSAFSNSSGLVCREMNEADMAAVVAAFAAAAFA